MNIADIASFYSTPLGKATQALLDQRLHSKLAVKPDQLLLGLGFAPPYLKPQDRTVAFMPARGGGLPWPADGTSRSALVDELDLPLGDNVVEVAVLIHALEFSESPDDLLAEIWRVLAPRGRLILVVPNRTGFWASSEASPFGQGQPFSRRQILTLLKQAQFTLGRLEFGLVAPPWAAGTAGLVEPLSRFGLGHLSGVIVVEAIKQVYAYSSGRLIRRALPRLRPVLIGHPTPARRDIGKAFP